MRRILAIILLAALLVLTLSVPALADPSSPSNAYGQGTSWWVQRLAKNYGMQYGHDDLRWIMWGIQAGITPWENGGEYIAYLKDYYSD